MTERSKKLRSDLKDDILSSVSELRKIFSQLVTDCDSKKDQIRKLEGDIQKLEDRYNDGGQNAATF